MSRWIRPLALAGWKSRKAQSGNGQTQGPTEKPDGIDHLMLKSRSLADTVSHDPQMTDRYAELMPIRRLPETAAALLEAPAVVEPLLPSEPLLRTEQIPAPTGMLNAGGPASVNSKGSEKLAGATEPLPFKVPHANIETLHALASLAYDQRDFEAAAGWWRLMRLAFPNIFHGHADGAMALIELGRFDEARQLLEKGAPSFPDEPAFAVTLAQMEARLGDWAASTEAWRAALQFPASPWWVCIKLVEALEHSGAPLEEIDSVLRRSCRDLRFRAPGVLTKAVVVAFKRQDWMELAERLRILGDISPLDEILDLELDSILVSMRSASPAALLRAIDAPWVSGAIASPQTEPRRLILQARLAQLAGRGTDVMAKLAALRPAKPLTKDQCLCVESILRDAGFSEAADKAFEGGRPVAV